MLKLEEKIGKKERKIKGEAQMQTAIKTLILPIETYSQAYVHRNSLNEDAKLKQEKKSILNQNSSQYFTSEIINSI